RGDGAALARAVELPAVVRTLQPAVADPAATEGSAAVGAGVREAVRVAFAVPEQREIVAEHAHPHGLTLPERIAFQGRIPEIDEHGLPLSGWSDPRAARPRSSGRS